MPEQILNVDLSGSRLDRPSSKGMPEPMRIGMHPCLITKPLEHRTEMVLVERLSSLAPVHTEE